MRRCQLWDTVLNQILTILFHLFYPGWTKNWIYLLLLHSQGFLTMHNTYGQTKSETGLIFKRVLKTAHFWPKSRAVKLCFQIPIEYYSYSLNLKGHTKNPGCFRKPWASAPTWLFWKKKFWWKNYCSRRIFLKNISCSLHFSKNMFFGEKVNYSMTIGPSQFPKHPRRPSDSGRHWCKTLGVRNVQLWLLEAAKVVKKCEFRNPDNNQGCQLFQTLPQFTSYRLFLAIPGKLTSSAFLGLSGYIWSLGCLSRELKPGGADTKEVNSPLSTP